MIGLVFGFAFAVLLLFLCIGAIGLVIVEPRLLLIPVGLIVVLWAIIDSQPEPPVKTSRQLCIEKVDRDRYTYVSTVPPYQLNQAVALAKSRCR